METVAVPIDPSLQTPEAGPSRTSPPPRSTSIPPENPSASAESSNVTVDEMPVVSVETISALPAPIQASEDVALLLNIAASTDPRPEDAVKPPLLEQSISPKDSTFPHTPPDEPHHPSQTPSIAAPPSTLSHILETRDIMANGTLSSPQANSPEPVPKATTKGKRKRNAQAGPSRSNDPERPPHWMGEDNTVIRCICGIIEDDGFTIQCEECGAWEHGLCFGYQDEESAPEIYLCELCEPRPYDAEGARARQRDARLAEDHRRLALNLPQIAPIPVQPAPVEAQSRKGKGRKRPRIPGHVEGDVEAVTEPGKDQSPAGPSGIPGVKPKRRPTANKPRSKPAPEPASGPPALPVFKEPLPPVDLDDEYFTIEPWEMEYTHVQHNVVRGKAVRQALSEFYREWADADVEDISTSKRVITNPSGLPSPTETGVLRLSTEDLYPGPDFDILAPPIPPVFLSGPNLELLVAKTHVEAITDPASFLPLNYAEVASLGVYRHPAIYGVILDKAVSTSAFIGEYRGEVIDCETYRRDRVNQYSQLGMTKPFVRTIGPPVNLMIDARGYGSHMRFARSSCHPNAVLRPFLWRKDESEPAKLKFGVFACRSISRNEEITLGWEWDDQHVVHSLRHVIMSVLAPDSDFGLSDADLQNVTSRYEKILTHLYGTFTSCACIKPANCAVAQMRLLVEGKEPLVELNEKGKVKVEFGELVGAVRGWRKRELQEEERRRWEVPGAFDTRRFARARSASSSPTPMRAVQATIAFETPKEDGDMDIAEDAAEDDEANDETEDDLPPPDMIHRRKSSSIAGEEQDISMDSSPAQSPHLAAPPLPASSVLSSAPSMTPTQLPRPSIRAPSFSPSPSPAPEIEEDDGHASDATTITIPRSQFSEAEDMSESEVDQPAPAVTPVASKVKTKKNSPAKQKVKAKVNGKVKKVRMGDTATSRPAIPRRSTGRKNRVMSSPASDSEHERMDIDEPVSSPVKPPPQTLPTVPSPKTSPVELKEELRAVVPDQIVAPMADPTEAMSADEAMTIGPVVSVEEPVREDTPKEPPLPPRDPTPEPEPKKISLTEYLRKHKMSKKPTPVSEHEPLPDVSGFDSREPSDQAGPAAPPAPAPAVVVPSASASAPGLGPSATTMSPVSTVAKAETDTSAARLNLLEFLPSSRPSTSPVATTSALPSESPRPLATPSSAAYVPRSEYFPQQHPAGAPAAAPAFVPRSASMSYAPRAPATPADDAPNGHAYPPASFTPRQASIDTSAFLPPRQERPDEIKPIITPPSRSSSLPDGTHSSNIAMPTSIPTGPSPTPGIPPALPQRDPPPHATPVRQPPTGPKVPPSGPRGYPVPPLAANRPVGTVEQRNGEGPGGPRMNFIPAPRPAYARGGYGRIGDRFEGERGGYGGFRGRGGFGRGRGRGA